MIIENKKIAIIGGGPGGLTLARLLQLKGADVKVYERDFSKDIRTQGATLDLHFDSGLKALTAAGLMDVFEKLYRPGAEKGRVLDKDANILYDDHDTNGTDLNSKYARPEIDRSDLRTMLLNSLQPDTVVWDSHFVSMSPVNEGWKLEFKNGATAFADIVIGADGGNSKIRPFVTPISAAYAGTTIFQGNIENGAMNAPTVHHLLKGGKLYMHSEGKYFHISSKGDGSIDFYISCKIDEHWVKNSGIDFSDRAQLKAWFQNEFKGWNPLWLELIAHVDLPLLIRPQYYVPLNQSWEAHTNITLIGDAAHIMAPSGEGVNLAMLDALELSEYLTNENYKDVQSAIAAYEKPMQQRASAEGQTSLDMIEWMHAEDANEKLVQMFNAGT